MIKFIKKLLKKWYLYVGIALIGIGYLYGENLGRYSDGILIMFLGLFHIGLAIYKTKKPNPPRQ